MSRAGAGILVRRGEIEGHTRPPGGDFAKRALVPGFLTPLVSSSFGVHCVDTTQRVVALTYDDGPHPEHTPRVLDALAAHQAPATFFVLTTAARKHPQVLRRILEAGHQIGLHGADHRSLLTMNTTQAVEHVRRARQELEQLTEAPVSLYRPPYGQHTLRQARALRQLGLEILLWSGDGMDWVDQPVEEVVDRACQNLFPGAVLLMHDDRADPETLVPGESLPQFDKGEVADRLLRRIVQHDLTVVPVEQLLAEHRSVFSVSRERILQR